MAFGIVFDEFFYSRKNIAPFVVVAVLGALTVGALVELAIIRIRLRFLIGFESSHGGGSSPPKWMVPKFYDFWLGFVVTAFMVPVFLLGAVPSAVS